MGCKGPSWAFAGWSGLSCGIVLRRSALDRRSEAFLARQASFQSGGEIYKLTGRGRAKQSGRIRAQQERRRRDHGSQPDHSRTFSTYFNTKRVPRVRQRFGGLSASDCNENSAAIDSQRQQLCARGDDSGFDARARVRVNHEREAAAAARAADFSGKRALTPRGGNHPVDQRSRNRAKIAAAEFPFFAHQAANFVPLVSLERGAHRLARRSKFFPDFAKRAGRHRCAA